jgi:hypothetical protein
MDATLRAILSELFAMSVEVDRLRARIAELEEKNGTTDQPHKPD